MNWTRFALEVTFFAFLTAYWYRQGLKDGRAGR